ncbi:MAG: hypothetical protein MZV64_13330 [Ignavibacteriales bacterium]|nr:hypothetical protein [Ignavibacteriales bacterium]
MFIFRRQGGDHAAVARARRRDLRRRGAWAGTSWPMKYPGPGAAEAGQHLLAAALIWPPGLLDMACLGWLLAVSRKEADPGRRKVDAAFAWLFLAAIPCTSL